MLPFPALHERRRPRQAEVQLRRRGLRPDEAGGVRRRDLVQVHEDAVLLDPVALVQLLQVLRDVVDQEDHRHLPEHPRVLARPARGLRERVQWRKKG
eukprot:gene2285-biopygen7962